MGLATKLRSLDALPAERPRTPVASPAVAASYRRVAGRDFPRVMMVEMAIQTSREPTDRGVLERLAEVVCRRAFSSPEALAYELAVAPALAEVVGPELRSHLSGTRILDVGCGGGRIACSIAADGPTSVFGVDASLSQVRRFSRRHRKGLSVWPIQARAEHLPFRNHSFDTVFSSCAWKLWSEPEVGLAECVRVTRPGGQLVIVEIDGASTVEEFRRFAKMSRIPYGMQEAYVRFAMRTVVGVAPDRAALEASFASLRLDPPAVRRIGDLPFLVVVASVV